MHFDSQKGTFRYSPIGSLRQSYSVALPLAANCKPSPETTISTQPFPSFNTNGLNTHRPLYRKRRFLKSGCGIPDEISSCIRDGRRAVPGSAEQSYTDKQRENREKSF